MNINEFNQYLCIELSKMLKDVGRADPVEIPKNNITLHAASVHFYGQQIGPTIYTDDYFELWNHGVPMEHLLECVKAEALKHREITFDISSINKDNAQSHLRAAVVNFENNKEWLKDVPHERMQDLAVFAKWAVGENSFIRVNSRMAGVMQMTKEEILQTAKGNTLKSMKLKSMSETILEMMRENGEDKGLIADMEPMVMASPLHVLSNQQGVDGAALIANPKALKKAYEELGEEFYILPASIHEVLLLPKSECSNSVEELKEMVCSINEAEVGIEDRLSGNIYEFDGQHLKMAGEETLKLDTGLDDIILHRRSR